MVIVKTQNKSSLFLLHFPIQKTSGVHANGLDFMVNTLELPVKSEFPPDCLTHKKKNWKHRTIEQVSPLPVQEPAGFHSVFEVLELGFLCWHLILNDLLFSTKLITNGYFRLCLNSQCSRLSRQNLPIRKGSFLDIFRGHNMMISFGKFLLFDLLLLFFPKFP